VIQSQMAALDAQLRDLDASMKQTVEDMRTNRLTGRLDLSFLAAHRRYTLAMQKKAMEIAQQMAAVQRKIDQAQRRLTEAVKHRKVIEKLRQRQFERWRQKMARRELYESDEVAMLMGRYRPVEPRAGVL